MADLPLIPGTLAQDCYPASAQAFYDDMFAKGHAVGPTVTGILIQDNTPDPEDQDKGWIPTSGGVSRYPGYIFVWNTVLGHWVSRHPFEASDPRPQLYIGTLADLQTFDGGDANAAGVAGGPMWEQWTAITGRVPVGVGLIPGSSPAASITTVLDTSDSLGGSGEYKHVLTEAEGAVGDHIHPIGVCDPASDDGFLPLTSVEVTPAWTGHYMNGSGSLGPTAEATANLFSLKADNGAGVVSDQHNNMMPFIGVYWIKRTARIWIVAA